MDKRHRSSYKVEADCMSLAQLVGMDKNVKDKNDKKDKKAKDKEDKKDQNVKDKKDKKVEEDKKGLPKGYKRQYKDLGNGGWVCEIMKE